VIPEFDRWNGFMGFVCYYTWVDTVKITGKACLAFAWLAACEEYGYI